MYIFTILSNDYENISNEFCKFACELGFLVHCDFQKQSIFFQKGKKKILLSHLMNNANDVILLLKNTPIQNTQNLKYLLLSDIHDFLYLPHIPIISFGMEHKNTITLSSNDREVIIAVQREITALNNKIIEPREYKFNIKNSYTHLLGFCALAIILDMAS